MDRPSRKGLPKKICYLFLLLVVLIGSSISSIGLMGLTISPQYAWAAVPSQPVFLILQMVLQLMTLLPLSNGVV